MGLRSSLGALAARAPVPVFAAIGEGARDAVEELRLRDELRFVDSPRAAAVLLIAGPVPDSLGAAALSVHDSLSHPRATVWWTRGTSPGELGNTFTGGVFVEDDPTDAIVRVYRELVTGNRPSEAPILPDVDPAPWRGLGPYGQGGSGMTGGVPFGRPLAERGSDRDGLTLDQVFLRAGPFLPALPPGLVLDVVLQGDLVQKARIVEAGRGAIGRVDAGEPFAGALEDAVPIAELEMARSRSHLRWLSQALRAHDLDALAMRVLHLAARVGPGDADSVRKLARTVRRTGILSWSTAGVGRLAPESLNGLGAGPVARAAAVADDLRTDDLSYRALGFEPVIEHGGDAAARWRCRLAEASQSLDLAARAGDRIAPARAQVECPRGRLERGSHPSARLLSVVPSLVEGAEWSDAVTALVSLDLDVDGIRASRTHEKSAR